MVSAASCRPSRLVRLISIIAVMAVLGRGGPSAQSTPQFYGLTPIGQLGGSQSAAYDVSEAAQWISGRTQTASGAYHAFVQDSLNIRDLGTLGGRDSTAFASTTIAVVGQAQTAAGQYHAFAFDRFRNATIDLGTLGGTWSAAYDVNNEFVIVGASRIAGDARMRAFKYENGAMTALPVDLGGDSVARGISELGDIVGSACAAGNTSCRPFLLSSGVTTFIGAANRTGTANRVNFNQDVVGALSAAGSTATHAFLFSGGVLTDLGTLGGSTSEARGINDKGDVVGTALNAAGLPRAFLWRGDVKTMTDLNTVIAPGSGWVLESAAAISEGGQIVGYGSLNGKRRAFLLSPPIDLEARVSGIISQHDSNLPRDGIEVGKTVEWTTSVVSAPPLPPLPPLMRTVYGTRITHTLSGPAVFVSATTHDADKCTVTPAVITCDFQPFDSDGIGGREATIRARATGVGVITHHATVSSNASDPNGANDSISETNRAVALSTFTVTPASVAGGQASIAEVTLTDRAPGSDALVKFTSSRPDIVSVPATFDVPSWTDHRNFQIVPAVVTAPTTVQITASYGLVTLTRTLTVVPAKLKQLYLTPTTIIGGCGQSQGRVVLTGTAPAGGTLVPLTNTNSKATVPQSVRVPAGSDSVSFTVPTIPVTSPASGVVTASFGGVSQSLNVTVRPIRAQTLTLSSTRVRGGTTVSGAVALECAAVPGAIAVSFTSSNAPVAAATVPNITIPSGGTTGTFSVRTSPVTSETTVTIYAWVFGVRKGVTLTVTP